MSRKNILYVLHTVQIGGAAESLHLFLKELDRTKFNPIIWAGDDGAYLETFHLEGFKTYVHHIASFENTSHFQVSWSLESAYMIGKFIAYTIPTILSTIWIVQRERIHLVHINSSTPLICGIIARLMGVRVLWHVREVFPDNWIRRIQRRIILDCSNVIAAVSKRVVKDFGARNKVILVYNPVRQIGSMPFKTTLELRQELGLEPQAKVVGIVGQVIRVRGHFIFLAAAREVLRRMNNVLFIVVGQSPRGKQTTTKKIAKFILHSILGIDLRKDDDKLKMLIDKCSLSGRFIFSGYRRDVYKWMSAMDIVVCPNIVEEAFGRVVVEAFALKKVVIASRLQSFAEIIDHDVDGILVEPGNPRVLADAIIEIIADGARAKKLGENESRKIQGKFDVDSHTQHMNQIYDTLLRTS